MNSHLQKSKVFRKKNKVRIYSDSCVRSTTIFLFLKPRFFGFVFPAFSAPPREDHILICCFKKPVQCFALAEAQRTWGGQNILVLTSILELSPLLFVFPVRNRLIGDCEMCIRMSYNGFLMRLVIK